MEQKNVTCIVCPAGCQICVKNEGKEIISITGNNCKRGEEYARKEVTNPTRIVTSTVKVKNGKQTMVSVKTRTDISKDKIFDCIKALKEVNVEAPIFIGDMILENVAGTGVDIVATKDVEILV